MVTGSGMSILCPLWSLAFSPTVTVDIMVSPTTILQIMELKPMSYQAPESNYYVERNIEQGDLLGGDISWKADRAVLPANTLDPQQISYKKKKEMGDNM